MDTPFIHTVRYNATVLGHSINVVLIRFSCQFNLMYSLREAIFCQIYRRQTTFDVLFTKASHTMTSD